MWLFVIILHIIYDIHRHSFAVFIDASIKSATKKLNTHDRKYQPKHQTHQQHVDNGRNGIHQGIDNDLKIIYIIEFRDARFMLCQVNTYVQKLIKNEFTFIPCHRDIARRGRKARRVRNERRAVRFALPSMAKLRMDTCISKTEEC